MKKDSVIGEECVHCGTGSVIMDGGPVGHYCSNGLKCKDDTVFFEEPNPDFVITDVLEKTLRKISHIINSNMTDRIFGDANYTYKVTIERFPK